MDKPYKATQDIEVLSTSHPIPGEGLLPINAFVIKATEPVLVDTGIEIDNEEFMDNLCSIIDPKDLKWIWLTHDDVDHTGNLQKVLKVATNARLVMNAVAMLRMSTSWKVPIDRAYLLNPGESISVGDRRLTAFRPPLFDNPSTIGFYDNKSETLFSVDCFGAILPSVEWHDANDYREADLIKGMTTWAKADAPWIHIFDLNKFNQWLDKVRQMAPKIILSSHLQPARGKTEQFLKLFADISTTEPWIAPNQEALEQILSQNKLQK